MFAKEEGLHGNLERFENCRPIEPSLTLKSKLQDPLPVSALLPHSPSFTFNCSFPPRGGRCAYANIEENFIPYAG